MNDQQLEKALARRAILVPDAREASLRAMAALDLELGISLPAEADLGQGTLPQRNPWTIFVVVAPTLLSSLLVLILQKDAVLGLGTGFLDRLAKLMPITATSWQHTEICLSSVAPSPGALLTVSITITVWCLFACWAVAPSFAKQERVF